MQGGRISLEKEREKKGKKSTWSGDCIPDEETVRNWDEPWKEINVPAGTTGRLKERLTRGKN